MVKTISTMKRLGTSAPRFSLPDVISKTNISLEDYKGTVATVVMFLCNHCPYVKHINASLSQLAHDYQSELVRFIGINSNDIDHYPEDSPIHMEALAKKEHFSFPYLFDETQEVARAYDAACTPDFFVYDKDLKLAYRGQFDDSRPGNQIEVTGNSIRLVLESLLKNEPISEEQRPSLGCNIKWKN